MRQPLLDQQDLVRKLKQLLLLFSLLLLPSAAWGQWETQTFIFSGCRDNILYLEDSNDNTTSYAWNYQGARQYQGASFQDNKIKINVLDDEGKSTLSPSEGYKFTTKKVTFNYSNLTVTGDSKIYVRAVNRTDTTTHYTDPLLMTSNGSLEINLNEAGISSDDLKFLIFSNDNKAYSYDLTSITIIKIADYHISIGGVPLTGANVNTETGAVTGDGITGTVTYDATNNTLTLDNANIAPDENVSAIVTDLDNLTINLKGLSTISTSGSGYTLFGNGTTDKNILLTSTSDPSGSLILKTSGPNALLNDKVYIVSKEGETWDFSGSLYSPDVKESIIAKGTLVELLIVGNVVVTEENKESIQEGVSFDSDNKILTLSNATIQGNIQSIISPLKVHLIGSSSITPTNTNDAPFQYKGLDTGTLTFESSEADDGELTLGGTYTKVEVGESDKYYQFSSGNYTYSNPICAWYIKESYQYSRKTYTYWGVNKDENNDNRDKIFYNPHYGITVGDYEVTKFNKGQVTGTDGDFEYNPDDNYLFVPEYATLTNNLEIKSHRADLNIQISGDCTLKAIKFEAKPDEFGTPETKKLNISRTSTSTSGVNSLTIDTDNSGPAISGFTSVDFGEGFHYDIPETEPTGNETKVVISDYVPYDLWVKGKRVSSGNKDDILEDYVTSGTTPTVVFDGTNTLTLTGATISVDGNTNGIESGLEELTIVLKNYNDINFEDGYAFKGTGSNIISFDIDPNDPQPGSLRLFGSNTLFGDFKKEDYCNGLGLLLADGYLVEMLSKPEISSEATTGGITVTLNSPADPENPDDPYNGSTMYYSITNSDETIEAKEYTEPFTMTKPGTVTTYLKPSLGGQSKNEIGKYYGYLDAPYMIGTGDELLPTIYPAILEEEYIGFYDEGYSSNNETIATFAAGKITAKEPGTTTLTATLSGSDMAFTVLNPYDPNNSSHYPITFSVIVGENLDDLFAYGQVYGTYYNTSTTTYKVPEGITAYIVTGVNGDKVTVTETKVIPPNTPVLLEKGDKAIVFTHSAATDADGSLPSGNLLKYATSKVTVPDNAKLYVLFNGEFVKATAGSGIELKCYLDLSSANGAGARGFYEIGDGDTTGIHSMVNDPSSMFNGQWYDLQGRRIQKPTKAGLYIRNGKKVVVNNK